MKIHRAKLILFSIVFLSIFSSCEEETKTKSNLPILGERKTDTIIVDGVAVVDTIYHTIPEFRFTDQDGNIITKKSLAGKIYVADFFFTSCPTICPTMREQLLRVYNKYKGNDNVAILSHSIDPNHDTVEVLKIYAGQIGVKSDTWHFLTGDMDSIYDIAEKGYMVSAMAQKDAPGGFVHSGAFILVDKDGRIRGYYNGTDPNSVDKLIKDMKSLLQE